MNFDSISYFKYEMAYVDTKIVWQTGHDIKEDGRRSCESEGKLGRLRPEARCLDKNAPALLKQKACTPIDAAKSYAEEPGLTSEDATST